MVEFLIFAGVLLAVPPLVFTAAVLCDHILHGPNEPNELNDTGWSGERRTHHEER